MAIDMTACCKYAENIAAQLSDWSDTFGNGGCVTCNTEEIDVTAEVSEFMRSIPVVSWIILEDTSSETFEDEDTGEEDDGSRRLVVLIAYGKEATNYKSQLFSLAMRDKVACKEDYVVITPDCGLAYIVHDVGSASIYTMADAVCLDNYPELELNLDTYTPTVGEVEARPNMTKVQSKSLLELANASLHQRREKGTPLIKLAGRITD